MPGYWLGLSVSQFYLGGGTIDLYRSVFAQAFRFEGEVKEELLQLLNEPMKELTGTVVTGAMEVPGYPDQLTGLYEDIDQLLGKHLLDREHCGYSLGLCLHRLVALYRDADFALDSSTSLRALAHPTGWAACRAVEALGMPKTVGERINENLLGLALAGSERYEVGVAYLALVVNFFSNPARDEDLYRFLATSSAAAREGVLRLHAALQRDDTTGMSMNHARGSVHTWMWPKSSTGN